MNSIGGLWKNISKNNNEYMAGSVEIDGKTTKLIIFKNDYKKEDKHPDFKIFVRTPVGEQTENQAAAEVQTVVEPQPVEAEAEDEKSDDLPF